MIRKQFGATKEGEWLVVNTGAVDRDRDRVLPSGVELDNYLANPVLMWGHNYRDPWALIGRAAEIQLSGEDIRIRPELREPASEGDPMHIIRALWEGGLLRAASIGFNPVEWQENEQGGRDYTRWELLENSLVPIPANQEALRLAVKGLAGVPEDATGTSEPEFGEPDVADPFEGLRVGDVVKVVLKPYPQEHACRLRDPGDFQEGRSVPRNASTRARRTG
jgi:hypothetical protein